MSLIRTEGLQPTALLAVAKLLAGALSPRRQHKLTECWYAWANINTALGRRLHRAELMRPLFRRPVLALAILLYREELALWYDMPVGIVRWRAYYDGALIAGKNADLLDEGEAYEAIWPPEKWSPGLASWIRLLRPVAAVWRWLERNKNCSG